MNKKDVWKKFYAYLSDEEKADYNKLPDFVYHIADAQPKLSKKQIAWAQKVVDGVLGA